MQFIGGLSTGNGSQVRIMRWVVKLMLRSTFATQQSGFHASNYSCCNCMSPQVQPKLRICVLRQEYAKMKHAGNAERKNETDMTLVLDGWSDAQ